MYPRRSIPFLLLGSTFLFAAMAAQGDTPTVPAGKQVFLSSKCNTCHTVQAQSIEKRKAEASDEKEKSDKKAPDLSSVGLERKTEWIGKFLMKTESIKGEKHPRRFRGTEAELKTLSAWMEAQKAPKKK
jgi:mono/diheme cytochrome c family protein